MVSYHVFYQLMLLGLLWLFLMLHVVWPSARPAQKQRTTQPITPPHKRSKEPKPFIGLTLKPHCDACEQGVASRREPPCAPPPPTSARAGVRRRDHDSLEHVRQSWVRWRPAHQAQSARRGLATGIRGQETRAPRDLWPACQACPSPALSAR